MNKPIIEASCVVDGVEYHAKSARGCNGCAAEATTKDFTHELCGFLGPCAKEIRADRTNIVWVRAE